MWESYSHKTPLEREKMIHKWCIKKIQDKCENWCENKRSQLNLNSYIFLASGFTLFPKWIWWSNLLVIVTYKSLIIKDSEIKSPKPHRMKYHMKHIISLGWRMYLKVSPNLSHSFLHSYVLPWRNIHQNVLQVGNFFHRNLNWEHLPIQNITERRDIVIRNEHRNTPCVNCLHHSRACHLIPTRAEAKLALPQHAIVRNTLWEVLVNLNIFILFFPMLKKNWPNGAMNASSKECQNWTLRCRWPTK